MDGLSERKNQWVEQYLRLIAINQEDWATTLPLATLVHNNARNATTGYAPNELISGIEPMTIPEQVTVTQNPMATQRVDQLRERRALATRALNEAAEKARPTEARWKLGQKVWLEAKNLALPYRSAKLAPRRHGPFKIIQVPSPVTYKLRLPHQ